jgi:hypothetical protein
MKLCRIAVLLWFPCSLLASGLPTIKAKVAEPVLQELMGGCSLACAFPWETFAIMPGKSPQPVYKLNDSDASTAWIDPNLSVGTRLAFHFPKKLPKEMDGNIPFYGFDLVNGYIKSDDLFASYSRMKRAELFYNGKPVCYVNFADSKRWQHVNFDDIFAHQGDVFSVQILEIYPGKKFPNVAITQLVLQGAH